MGFKMTNKLLIGLIIIFTGCGLDDYRNKPTDAVDGLINERLEAYRPNLAPMYGNIKKSEKEKETDRQYIETMLSAYGDRLNAAKMAAKSGWNHFFKEHIDTAMFRFNQCWLLDSTFSESFFGFAAIREYQNLNDEAEELYQLGYKRDEDNTVARQCLHKIANIKERQLDTTGLISSYYRLLSRFPTDSIATGKLGFFYSELNVADSTLKYYDLTISLDPDYDQTYINKGWLLLKQEKINQAINEFSLAIKKNNKSIQAYANRANALKMLKRYDEAISDILNCIELDPKYSKFHIGLAECYFKLNQTDKGCKELDKAIEKGDTDAEVMKQTMC